MTRVVHSCLGARIVLNLRSVATEGESSPWSQMTIEQLAFRSNNVAPKSVHVAMNTLDLPDHNDSFDGVGGRS